MNPLLHIPNQKSQRLCSELLTKSLFLLPLSNQLHAFERHFGAFTLQLRFQTMQYMFRLFLRAESTDFIGANPIQCDIEGVVLKFQFLKQENNFLSL